VLKTFALIVRRPDLEREEFRRHYEEIHSPLALPLLEGTVRYVKYHLLEDLSGRADFDVISGFWYASPEAAVAAMRRFDGPEGVPIREDEQTFMDTARNTFFVVSEVDRQGNDAGADVGTDVGEVEGGQGSDQCFVFVKAPALERDAYLEGFDVRASERLRDAFRRPGFVLTHQVLGAPDAAWDRVLQVRTVAATRPEGVAEWTAQEEGMGATVLVVRTRLYETVTPWDLPG
jgi:uncharacterized protein (TIGR02118 family)